MRMMVGATVALFTIEAAVAAAPPRYAVTDLGVAPDFAPIFGASVNADGAVVGVATRSFLYPNGGGGLQERSFLRTAGGQQEILIFEGNVHAWDINGLGQVAGSTAMQSRFRAFVWQQGSLNILPPLGGSWSWCFSINDHGQVAGGSDIDEDDSAYHATLWQPEGTAIDLGSLGGSARSSNAAAVNNLGVVVGWSDTATWHVAFRWQDGEMSALPRPGAPESMDPTVALDLNDDGTIVGYVDWLGDDDSQPLVWRDGAVEVLPLPADRPIGQANAINSAGAIVGRARSEAQGFEAYRAMLWRSGRAVDLNSLIGPGSGWLLTEAADISDAGHIVGRGFVNGQLHGFLLTPAVQTATARD